MRALLTTVKPFLPLVAALMLAAGAGGFAAVALGTGNQTPTRTVTVDATGGTGPTGPAGPRGEQGPPGPPGPAGGCPNGYSEADVVFVQQGKGPTTIFTCLKD